MKRALCGKWRKRGPLSDKPLSELGTAKLTLAVRFSDFENAMVAMCNWKGNDGKAGELVQTCGNAREALLRALGLTREDITSITYEQYLDVVES